MIKYFWVVNPTFFTYSVDRNHFNFEFEYASIHTFRKFHSRITKCKKVWKWSQTCNFLVLHMYYTEFFFILSSNQCVTFRNEIFLRIFELGEILTVPWSLILQKSIIQGQKSYIHLKDWLEIWSSMFICTTLSTY